MHTITLDKLAKNFGLTAWDDLYDLNMDYIATVGSDALTRAVNDGLDEDAAQEAADEAEALVAARLRMSYVSAVEAAADTYFEYHGLKLVPVHSKPSTYKVLPIKSWADAAERIRATINGDGMFFYESLRVFVAQTAKNEREAALSHLHWMTSYAAVYGVKSARALYEKEIENGMRYV